MMNFVECDENSFGFKCEQQCGQCDSKCSHVDGYCEKCIENYIGYTCKQSKCYVNLKYTLFKNIILEADELESIKLTWDDYHNLSINFKHNQGNLFSNYIISYLNFTKVSKEKHFMVSNF